MFQIYFDIWFITSNAFKIYVNFSSYTQYWFLLNNDSKTKNLLIFWLKKAIVWIRLITFLYLIQYVYFEYLFEDITLLFFMLYQSLSHNGTIYFCFVHKGMGGIQNVGDTRDSSSTPFLFSYFECIISLKPSLHIAHII